MVRFMFLVEDAGYPVQRLKRGSAIGALSTLGELRYS